MTSQLYMIGTPLGNLEDVTLRARRLFEELNFFFAEDSREFKKLLNHFNIALQDKRVFSYASHNMKEATADALRLLQQGNSIGFVSDRGTPGISDPGAYLVQSAMAEGIRVVPIPGPSAVPTLISASGLLETGFYFQGFLPTTQKGRDQLYSMVLEHQLPLCFFESPKRAWETIEEMRDRFPQGKIFIGRELTKMYESLSWHTLATITQESVPDRGEYACLLIPGEKEKEEVLWKKEVELRSLSEKEWSKRMAVRFDISSSEIYNALQQVKKK